jgi:chromosome segregation ATPase
VKQCQNEHEDLNKNQSFRQSDRVLQQRQKVKKPQKPFDKGDYSTYAGLSFEGAGDSKDLSTPKKTGFLKKIDDYEKQIQQFTTELESFQKKVDELKRKLDAASSEAEYKDLRLSYDYNKLQVEKLQKEIEKNEKEKTDIQIELDGLDKQIAILECVLDSHQLTKDAENWQNRNERATERVLKVIKDRESLDMLRTNLNSRWQKLTSDPEPEKKRISIFSQDKPVKPEELAEPLCLKASAKIYFI